MSSITGPNYDNIINKFEKSEEITKADLGLWKGNRISKFFGQYKKASFDDIRAFVAKLKDNKSLTDQQKLKILNKYSEIEKKTRR